MWNDPKTLIILFLKFFLFAGKVVLLHSSLLCSWPLYLFKLFFFFQIYKHQEFFWPVFMETCLNLENTYSETLKFRSKKIWKTKSRNQKYQKWNINIFQWFRRQATITIINSINFFHFWHTHLVSAHTHTHFIEIEVRFIIYFVTLNWLSYLERKRKSKSNSC